MVRVTSSAFVLVLLASVALPISVATAQTFEFKAPTTSVTVNPNDPSGTVVVGFTIEQTSGVSVGTQGFSMGVQHDSAVLNTVSVVPSEGVLFDPSEQPDFFVTAEFTDGWTCGIVYGFYSGTQVEFLEPTVVMEVTYELVVGGPLDFAVTTPLRRTDTLGLPPVSNVVSTVIGAYPADTADGELTCVPASFVRGDMNGDGGINIADVFTAEDYLFLGGETPGCLAALDANGDSAIDIGDIIYELSYLFLGGDPMPAPFPACGPLPDGEALSCAESECSP